MFRRRGAPGACIVCGGESRRFGPNPDYPGADIVRCRSCGLLWTHPLPPADDRSDDYDGRYALHHADALPPHDLPHKDARASAQHRFVHAHTDLATVPAVAVLDVGCGIGSLLRAFAADPNVTDLVGIEPSGVMRARAADRLPERAVLMGGLFSAAAVGGRRFTLVAGSQVLEHVPEPQRRRRARARTARAAAVAGGPAMGTVEAFDHPNDPDGAWLRVVARNPVGDG